MRSSLLRALPYVVVGAAAAWLFWQATQFDFHRRPGTLGPDAWPKLVLGAMLAVCVYEVARILLSPRWRGGAAGMLQEMVERTGASHEAPEEAPAPRHPFVLAAGIALTALYVWGLPRAGFVLATAPYLVAFIALGGYRRWLVNVLVSGVGTLAMMFFFMKVVYISLPLGQEPLAQVMIALMRVMGIR